VEKVAAQVMLGAEGFPGGTAGIDWRKARSTALRGGVEGVGRAEGATAVGGGVGQGRLADRGVKPSAQSRSTKGSAGGAPASGDADDVVMDRERIGNGTLAYCGQCGPTGSRG